MISRFLDKTKNKTRLVQENQDPDKTKSQEILSCVSLKETVLYGNLHFLVTI